MTLHWTYLNADSGMVECLSAELGIHPVTARILSNRGIKTREGGYNFLNPRLRDLPNPFLLPDMDKAVQRIYEAIEKKEQISVFGDFDTDGLTSAALLVRFFRKCGIATDYYIPNRLKEGYGLNIAAIKDLHNAGTKLIITTDNGTNSCTEIAHASTLGIDTIVTDHHEISGVLPNAISIINPKRMGDDSPFAELSGVGVAFYLAAAIKLRLEKEGAFKSSPPDMRSFLDLVAIGTIADVAPLTGINRILVKHGLEMIKNSKSAGIRALLNASAADVKNIDTYSIAFRLAPRINAAGRLGRQDTGLKLLLTDDEREAEEIAEILNKMNVERQSLEKTILKEIEGFLDNELKERKSIVRWSEMWHPGVIGIAASRLASLHLKPTVLISLAGPIGRGSARSVGSFNITKALAAVSDLLLDYGGHKAAAGFDIEKGRLEEFRERFEEYASMHLSDADLLPTILLDSEIDVKDIGNRLVKEIEMLAPFGEGNPRPCFATSACLVKQARIVGSNHLKLSLTDDAIVLDAIGFGLGDRKIKEDERYRLAGTPEINVWNGTSTIQFKFKDIKPA